MPEEQTTQADAAALAETDRPRRRFRVPPLSRRLPILTGIAAVAVGLEYGRFHLGPLTWFHLSRHEWSLAIRLDAPLATAAAMILAGVGLVALSLGRDVRVANGVAAILHLFFPPFVLLALGPQAYDLAGSLGVRTQGGAIVFAMFLICAVLVAIRSARVLVRKPALAIALGVFFVAVQFVVVLHSVLAILSW